MSRIHQALDRARTTDRPEGALQGDLDDKHEKALLPQAPAEWVIEEVTPRPPPVRVSVSDPTKAPIRPAEHDTSSVWAFGKKVKEKLVVEDGVDHAFVEQYRRLAAALHLAQAERGADNVKIVMIASSVSAEGKTLTSVNLALTLSESYHRRVLLVDGDLRRPWLHEVFQVQNVGGLNDTLTAREAKIPILQLSKTLSLLTAGRPATDPMRVLSSERMQRVLQQARGKFDWVLLDTPPITLLSDASLLASKADLVVLVVEAGKTRFEVVQQAVDAVGRDRIVGVVLNRVDSAPPSVYARQEHEETDGSESTLEEGN